MDLLVTEIRFAQQLAANEKRIRDKSLKKLRKYLQAKSASKKNGFTHEDFQKIWKGLHYCMWMQDKPLIQEELAAKISQLVHDLGTAESKCLFIKVFIQTEAREWNGIDVWRIDKFMMLFRCMLTQSLMVLKHQNWKTKSVEGLMTVFTETLLNGDEDLVPFGLRAHFIDIYLDEISKVGGSKINAKQALQLIDPFIKFLQLAKNPDSLGKVVNKIFQPIVERTAELNHNKGKKVNSSGGNASQDLQIDGAMLADYMFELGKDASNTTKSRRLFYSIVKGLQNACEGILPGKLEMSTEDAIPKKMVGDAVSSLVQLEMELNEKPSKKQLKELKAEKKKKKALSNSEGKENTLDVLSDPIDSKPDKTAVGKKRKHADTDNKADEPFTKMKRNSANLPDNTTSKKTKKGSLNSKGWSVSVDSEAVTPKKTTHSNEGVVESVTPKSSKGKKKAAVVVSVKKPRLEDKPAESPLMDTDAKESSIEGPEKELIGKNKKKTPKRKSLKVVGDEVNGEKDFGQDLVEDIGQGDADAPNKGNKKSALKRKSVDIESGSDSSRCNEASRAEQMKTEPSTGTSQLTKAESEHLTTNGFTSMIQIKPSEDLEEGETEIFVPSKKYKGKVEMAQGKFADFESLRTPVAYVKKILAKTNKNVFGTPAYVKRKMETPTSDNALTGSARRVSFNMKKNQSQSFKDSLKSPIVPFNPTRTPDQSILKSKGGSVSSQGSQRKSIRKQSAETPPSTGSLKSLKTAKRGTPKGTPKAVNMVTPKMVLTAKLKRKVATDFFAL